MCDQMPTAVNLAKWKLAESVECTKCGRRETLEHVLSGCPKSLARYAWRHKQVLRVIVEVTKRLCDEANKSDIKEKTFITFIKEGEKVKLSNIKGAACILKPGVGW